MMLDLRFKQIQVDHTLFIKHSKIEEVITLLIYVDSMIITRNNENEHITLKQCLTKEFKIK